MVQITNSQVGMRVDSFLWGVLKRQRVKVVNSVDEQEDWGENKVSDLIRKWGDGWRLTPGLVTADVSHPRSRCSGQGPLHRLSGSSYQQPVRIECQRPKVVFIQHP